MHYIILDLEWDSGYHPKYQRFLNQILQIGAVRLNEACEIEDSFEITICSSFTKRVSGRFSRLTGITSDMMRSGIPFDEAVRRYNEWVGTDTVTMTWSDSDLHAIGENEKLLLPEGLRFRMEKYLDLQKYVQNEMRLAGHECNSQISLGDAAGLYEIETDTFSLHTARDDCFVSAALLQKTYVKERFEPYIRDTADPEFYRRLYFKPFYINDLSDPAVDRSQLAFCCDQCGATAKRTSKWHYRNRQFGANFECPECGRVFRGRVSFRKNFDSVTVKKKILEPKVKNEENPDEVQPVSETVQS